MSHPIGKIYPGPTTTISAEAAADYAAATSDPSPDYAGPDAICPPMLHVRLLLPVMEAVAGDPELALDPLRLVHGEHDATFHRPLRVGDRVETRAELASVTEKRSGLVVVSRLLASCAGVLAVEATTTFFIRAPRPPGPRPPRTRPPAPTPPPPDRVADWRVDDDQSHRYATASGDLNPIHTDPAAATAAGLPSIILHGLCTMALAGNAVTAAVGAQPRHLRRLGVRFAGLVTNGMPLQARIWDSGPSEHRFVVSGPDGKPVITNGIASFAG